MSDEIVLTRSINSLKVTVRDLDRVNLGALELAAMKQRVFLLEGVVKSQAIKTIERSKRTEDARAWVTMLNNFLDAAPNATDSELSLLGTVQFVAYAEPPTSAQTDALVEAWNGLPAAGLLEFLQSSGAEIRYDDQGLGQVLGFPPNSTNANVQAWKSDVENGGVMAGWKASKATMRAWIEHIQRNVIDSLLSTQQQEGLALQSSNNKLTEIYTLWNSGMRTTHDNMTQYQQ